MNIEALRRLARDEDGNLAPIFALTLPRGRLRLCRRKERLPGQGPACELARQRGRRALASCACRS
jgi:hypothetical protein